MFTETPTGWEAHPDEVLLDALAQQNLQALLELHRRYAPRLYALARREQVLDPERRVQDAWLFILLSFLCVIPAVFLLRRPSGGPAAAVDAH